MNFSCLSGICSVAGHVTRLREGPYRPPGKSIRPLITMVALLSACEVAVWLKKKLLVYWRSEQQVWSGYEGCDLWPPSLCSQQKAGLLPLPLEATPWKNTPLLFFVCLFFFAIYSRVLPNRIRVDTWAVLADTWGGVVFFLFGGGGGGDREWIFTLVHCWETNTSTSWS